MKMCCDRKQIYLGTSTDLQVFDTLQYDQVVPVMPSVCLCIIFRYICMYALLASA
jgi:hypothetical protein